MQKKFVLKKAYLCYSFTSVLHDSKMNSMLWSTCLFGDNLANRLSKKILHTL